MPRLIEITAAFLVCVVVAHAADLTVDNLIIRDTGHFEGKLKIAAPIHLYTVPTNGLLLYYPFRSDEGASITDYSGQGNHGTAQSGAWWNSTGRVDGGTFDFDGVDDYISVGATGVFEILSTSCWFNNPSAISKGTTSNTLLSFYYGPSSGNCGVKFGSATDLLLHEVVSVFSPTTSAISAWCEDTDSIASGWHHLATKWDGASLYEIWLDGEQINNCSNAPPQPKWNNRIENIGAGSQPSEYFTGKIDEVLMYDRSLSDAEIIDLYLYGLPGITNAGQLTVGSIAAVSNDTVMVYDAIQAKQGISYVPETGDISMGAFTNQP